METSVETLCNQLVKHKLLEGEMVRSLHGRWRAEARGAPEDVQRFGKWLVSSRYLTEFQADLLLRGFADLLFIDEYKLVERIGQGRMAGVYKAVHNLGAPVALKVLPPSKAKHGHLLARFQREARLAMRLNHPNTVRTFQQGQTRGGLNYIVMEFLDGESLEDVLKRRGKLTVPETIHVGLHVLDGLQHLHEEGLVHRDLKPGNLMLVPGTPRDTTLNSIVKILDIGLGRALFDEGSTGGPENPDLTSEGSLLGTPRYMAPEQARDAHSVDIRADIYSLGCILYEMLAGEAPFADTSLMRQIMRHATETPRSLRERNPEVPPELWEVIETMLVKDPAQRFAVPSRASKALQPLLDPKLVRRMTTDETPQMKSYLTWVKTRLTLDPPTEPAPEPVAAAPAATPPPAPRPQPVTAPAPAVAPPAPQPPAPLPLSTKVPSGPIPVAQVPAPVAIAPAPPPAPGAPAPAKQTAPLPAPPLAKGVSPPPPAAPAASPVRNEMKNSVPVAQPVSPGSVPLPASPLVERPGKLAVGQQAARWRTLLEWLAKKNITHRDLLAGGIGAGALLLLELFLWLLVRWFTG